MARTLAQAIAAVARIEAAVGNMTRTVSEDMAVVKGYIEQAPSVTPIPPTPVPGPGTIPPLSAASRDEVIAAIRRSTEFQWQVELADRIEREMKAGVYSICDPDLVGGLNFIIFGPMSKKQADQAIVERYRLIVDQRGPDGGLLPVGDPRIKQVSGSTTPAPTPSPTPAPIPPSAAGIVAALAALDIHVAPGYMAIGMDIDFDNQSPIQVGGRVAAEIAGYSDTRRVAGQGPGAADSCNTVALNDGDGGVRWRQYGKFGRKGFIRNTLTRPFTVTAMDSVGEICQSQMPVGSNVEGGQNWYIKTSWVRKVVSFVTFKAGWKVEIAESSAYSAGDIKKL